MASNIEVNGNWGKLQNGVIFVHLVQISAFTPLNFSGQFFKFARLLNCVCCFALINTSIFICTF